MRNGESLEHLRALFRLGPPPDLVRLGLYNAAFDYENPTVTDRALEAFAHVRATVEPHRAPMTDDPADHAYHDEYRASFDAEGRLHSVDDQPARYVHQHSPSEGTVVATYYVHGQVARPNDLPDVVGMRLLPSPELQFLAWNVPSRPGDAPTEISKNGATGYGFSWLPGRRDAPTAVRRYDRQWAIPTDVPLPRWLWPPPAVCDIAYMAADPLTDADARLLVQQFDTVEPEPDERALLARTLLRWQRRLSEDTRNWLQSLI